MVIDTHTHLFTPEVTASRESFFTDSGFAALYRDPGSKIISANELLWAMDASGIDRSVVMGFPWTSRELTDRQNRYFSRLKGNTGGRLLPFGTVLMDEGEAGESIAEQVHAIKQLGLCGIGEVAFYGGAGDGFFPFLDGLLEAAETYELPVCLHVNEPVGHGYPGKYDTGFGDLYRLIEAHPGADVVLAHWGGGLLFYELMPEVRRALRRTWYDTAASPYLYDDVVYEVALKILGSKKILFGSDYPLIGPRRYIVPLEESSLSTEEREDILGGNARRLLRLD